MSKNKGKKVIRMSTTPESYIKTRARNLPLGKCYINEGWQNSGFASIIVARGHINGNFTFGVFLVDLYCLGVKDTFYVFNKHDEFYEVLNGMREQYEMEEIEYALAHNIIYGAVEYADSFGFKPHKDFDVSQYLLEEDDDRVELMDIEFGLDGKPAILIGKEKHPENIIAKMERSAGKGNFTIITEDDLDNEQDEEWEEDDFDDVFDEDEEDDYEEDEEDDEEELTEENIAEMLEGKKKMSPANLAKLVFVFYEQKITDTEKEEINEIVDHVDTWQIVDENEIEEPVFLNSDNEKQYDVLFKKTEFHPKVYLPEIQKLIAENPDEYNFYYLLIKAYQELGKTDAVNKTISKAYKKFPQNIFAFSNYITMHILEDNFAPLKDMLGNGFKLNQFFPKKKKICYSELVPLTNALFLYYNSVNQKHKAIAYALTFTSFIFYGDLKEKAKGTLLLATQLMFQKIGIAPGNDNEFIEEIEFE